MKTVRDFYDNNVAGWNEAVYDKNRDVISKFIDCFVGGGTINPRILDLGCGVGYDSKLLTQFGAKVVGVDLSEKSINLAKENVSNVKFFVGDATEKLDKLGVFDGVYCTATIMHIEIEKMQSTFDNIANVLHEGGLLLISAYDGVGKNMKKSLIKMASEEYDNNFNNYNVETICSFAHPRLKLVDMWKFDDFDEGWRYYIFSKVN